MKMLAAKIATVRENYAIKYHENKNECKTKIWSVEVIYTVTKNIKQ